MSEGPLPECWEPRDTLEAMVRGALRKAVRCEREGLLGDVDFAHIRACLLRTLDEIKSARWRQPTGPPASDLSSPLGEVRPDTRLPTERDRLEELLR